MDPTKNAKKRHRKKKKKRHIVNPDRSFKKKIQQYWLLTYHFLDNINKISIWLKIEANRNKRVLHGAKCCSEIRQTTKECLHCAHQRHENYNYTNYVIIVTAIVFNSKK